MKTYLPYIVTLIVISLFLVSTIDSENKIENLEVDVENKTLYIWSKEASNSWRISDAFRC